MVEGSYYVLHTCLFIHMCLLLRTPPERKSSSNFVEFCELFCLACLLIHDLLINMSGCDFPAGKKGAPQALLPQSKGNQSLTHL